MALAAGQARARPLPPWPFTGRGTLAALLRDFRRKTRPQRVARGQLSGAQAVAGLRSRSSPARGQALCLRRVQPAGASLGLSGNAGAGFEAAVSVPELNGFRWDGVVLWAWSLPHVCSGGRVLCSQRWAAEEP